MVQRLRRMQTAPPLTTLFRFLEAPEVNADVLQPTPLASAVTSLLLNLGTATALLQMNFGVANV